MKRVRVMLCAAVVSAVAGCSGLGAGASPRAQVLFTGAQCGRSEPNPAARWVTRDAVWQSTYGALRANGSKAVQPPSVDFDERGVLVVYMGRRPTAGYRLLMHDTPLSVRDGVARLTLEWQAPPPDAVTAQIITSPCIAVSLPLSGVAHIEVYDQQGNRRLRLDAAAD